MPQMDRFGLNFSVAGYNPGYNELGYQWLFAEFNRRRWPRLETPRIVLNVEVQIGENSQ